MQLGDMQYSLRFHTIESIIFHQHWTNCQGDLLPSFVQSDLALPYYINMNFSPHVWRYNSLSIRLTFLSYQLVLLILKNVYSQFAHIELQRSQEDTSLQFLLYVHWVIFINDFQAIYSLQDNLLTFVPRETSIQADIHHHLASVPLGWGWLSLCDAPRAVIRTSLHTGTYCTLRFFIFYCFVFGQKQKYKRIQMFGYFKLNVL